MKDFGGKLAVITGAGTGMGRELARQLIAEGCDVAICDVSTENMNETVSICESEAPQGKVISAFKCDVGKESDLLAWRDHIKEAHQTDHINLLFNNAGIGGGGSFINDTREEWERTFNICWNGVYYGCRTFMPMLLASAEGHIVNTSSINGFWATLGPSSNHTAYSSAKFAVKGFSEALINDLRNNAPHVKVSVVMPGHIGTSIAINSGLVLGKPKPLDMSDTEAEEMRKDMLARDMPVEDLSAEELRQAIHQVGVGFRDNAPTTAAEAVTIILDGVKAENWRILVGDDAHVIDQLVRDDPENAYEESFMQLIKDRAGWALEDVTKTA